MSTNRQPAPRTLRERVRYAISVIRAGKPTSRRFDSCFEMFDGDEVVAAIRARSLRDDALRANLSRYLTPES